MLDYNAINTILLSPSPSFSLSLSLYLHIYCVIGTVFINLCLVKYKHRNNVDSAMVEILITIHDLSPPPATHVML
jgi:hypothetical protein